VTTRTPTMVRTGGVPAKVRVSLRVYGELLDPETLTEGFGVKPSQEYRRGDIISRRRPDATRPQGMWLLDSVLAADASIEEQIGHILDRLPDSVSLWESLTGNYNRDLFCGILISQQVSGISLSSSVIRRIADRGLDVHTDLMVENDDDQE
jgi:hypothetical protein